MVLELANSGGPLRSCRLLAQTTIAFLGILFFLSNALAQQPEPAAVVTLVTDATVGIAPVSVGSTIFSGDAIKTGAAGQLQMRAGAMQFVLEPNSAARIFKANDRIILELEQGTIGYTTNGAAENLTIFAQDIKFAPHTNEPAVGRVSIISPCSVRATAARGSIDATSGTENKLIEAGKSYAVLPENAVQYSGAWKPQVSDYPDYPRDAEYHRSHNHVSCVAKESKANGRSPVSAGNPGHFNQVLVGAIGVVAVVALHKALESPDKP